MYFPSPHYFDLCVVSSSFFQKKQLSLGISDVRYIELNRDNLFQIIEAGSFLKSVLILTMLSS